MTAGFHSPLPPARTGVADYAAALLQALQQRGRVVAGAESADVDLYHLGNNQLHREIHRRALARPGVVVLHDAVLHHFYLGALSCEEYVNEFAAQYGGWNRDLAEVLWRERAASAGDRRYFEFPMLRRVVESARAVVVHNPAAARAARAHGARRVVEIPHLFEAPPPVDAADAAAFRSRLGIPQAAFVFGVFGYLRESKRILTALRAFERARAVAPRAALLIAGEFVSADLERAVAPFLGRAGIYRIGHLSDRDFWRAAAATDVCINLRYPAAGETSGIAIRMMGTGKPVIVTDGEEVSNFPEAVCLRVRSGVAEAAELFEHMILMATQPVLARRIGRCAKSWVEEHHALDLVASRYWEILCEVSEHSC